MRCALVGLLGGLLLIAGCGLDEDDYSDLPSRAELVPGSASPTEEVEESEPPSELPPEWQEDSNGNHVPDFIMERLGWDPESDRCTAMLDCGQGGTEEVPLREFKTLLLLDASGSMMDDVDDGQKMELAKDALEYYVTGLPDAFDVGFMAYGHVGSMAPEDYDASCEGVELIGDIGEVTYETLPDFLEPLSPTGFTPLGLALEESAEALREHDESVNRVIVVSDGQETCDGDPVAAAQELYDSGSATVDVLAFDVPEEQLPSLVEIADAGGGDLVVADDGEELQQALGVDLAAFHELAETQACMVNESVAVKACLAAQQTRISVVFDEILAEGDPNGGDWDEGQREQIIQVRTESELWNVEQQEVLEGQALPHIQTLGRSLAEAEERLTEIYGENLDGEHEPDPQEEDRAEDPDDGEGADDEGWIDLPPVERPTIPPLSDASTPTSRLTFFEQYSCATDVGDDRFLEPV